MSDDTRQFLGCALIIGFPVWVGLLATIWMGGGPWEILTVLWGSAQAYGMVIVSFLAVFALAALAVGISKIGK